ncbi:MAG: GNAT family N-acetyltransferase [Promethearchaeota archaeon]
MGTEIPRDEFRGALRALLVETGARNWRGVVYLATKDDPGPEFAHKLRSTLDEYKEGRGASVNFVLVVSDTFLGLLYGVFRQITGFKVTSSTWGNVNERVMGRNFNIVVVDIWNQLVPNDFLICVEACLGRGLVVLVGPPIERLTSVPTRFFRYLCGGERGGTRREGGARRHFTERISRYFRDGRGWLRWDEETGVVDFTPPGESPVPVENVKGSRGGGGVGGTGQIVGGGLLGKPTTSQAAALVVLDDLFKKHNVLVGKARTGKKKAIVITGERGRGKSSLLGMWLAGFFHQTRLQGRGQGSSGPRSAILTSKDLSQVQETFNRLLDAIRPSGLQFHLMKEGRLLKGVKTRGFSVMWVDFQEIAGKKRVDVVLVDEAGSVPVSGLLDLVAEFPFVVLATTTGGYEGTGRSFNLQVLPRLAEETGLEVASVKLEEPVRYGAGDPLEGLLYDLFLLGEDTGGPTVKGGDDPAGKPTASVPRVIGREELFSDEALLGGFWGILKFGHYRNSPNDLMALGDQPGVVLIGSFVPGRKKRGHVTGAMHLIGEGELARDDLKRGMAGHLVAFQLSRQYQLPEFASLRGLRVVRIAVHPHYRRTRVGSGLLQGMEELANKEAVDWCGASFNLTSEVLHFWRHNGYIPAFLTPVKKASNPDFSLTVVKPLSEPARRLISPLAFAFREVVVGWLRDNLYRVDPEVVADLLEWRSPPTGSFPGEEEVERYSKRLSSRYRFSETNCRRLRAFARGDLDALVVVDLLDDLFRWYWLDPSREKPGLSRLEAKVSVLRLMGRTWTQISSKLHVRPSEAYGVSRKIVGKLIPRYAGDSRAG